MKTQNKLWQPEEKAKHKPVKKTISDPLCDKCPNKPCKGLCPPMQWINGNTPSKEVLLTDLNTQDMESRDYKEDLIEMIEHRQARITSALDIKQVKHRAIAILLLAGISQKDISELFSMSYRQINRISIKVK
jgi:hypothetical protein